MEEGCRKNLSINHSKNKQKNLKHRNKLQEIMFVNAKLRNLRIAPRKVRLVVDLIRGKSVEKAQTILNFTVKEAAGPVSKLLKGAIANAKNNFQIEELNLYISKITVDEGRKYKRWMPRARGKADQLQKKTSHINIVLDEIKKESRKAKKKGKAKKKAAPAAKPAVSDKVSISTLVQAKKMAEKLGGVEKAKAALDALAKLQ